MKALYLASVRPLLPACVLMTLSACATTETVQPTVQPATPSASAGETRTVIAAGKYEPPPEISPSSMNRMLAADERTSSPDHGDVAAAKSGTRISGKEARVNIRSAPSAKSAVLTTLKAGQEVKVLETRDTWVRISWIDGVTPRNGWMKKTYIEGY